MNKRKTGAGYETVAADYLAAQGLTVVERNYRCRIGEIDLIAIDRDRAYGGQETSVCVFVEVKYRRSGGAGEGFEAVDHRKKRTICRVADHYRLRHGGLDSYQFRFDVISILGDKITWFRDAFPYLP